MRGAVVEQFLFYYQRPNRRHGFHVVVCYRCALLQVPPAWSIRNLDIILLILLTPGLMFVYEGRARPTRWRKGGRDVPTRYGYPNRSHRATLPEAAPTSNSSPERPVKKGVWNFEYGQKHRRFCTTGRVPETFYQDAASPVPSPAPSVPTISFREPASVLRVHLVTFGLWALDRPLLLDTTMVRRPLLEPKSDERGTTFIESLLSSSDGQRDRESAVFQSKPGVKLGPGYDLFRGLASYPNVPPIRPWRPIRQFPLGSRRKQRAHKRDARINMIARIMLIVSNLVLVLGIVAIATGTLRTSKRESVLPRGSCSFPTRRR